MRTLHIAIIGLLVVVAIVFGWRAIRTSPRQQIAGPSRAAVGRADGELAASVHDLASFLPDRAGSRIGQSSRPVFHRGSRLFC